MNDQNQCNVSFYWLKSLEDVVTNSKGSTVLCPMDFGLLKRRGEEVIVGINTDNEQKQAVLSNGITVIQSQLNCNSVAAAEGSAFLITHPTSVGLSLELLSTPKPGEYILAVVGHNIISLARFNDLKNELIVGQFFRTFQKNPNRSFTLTRALFGLVNAYVSMKGQGEVTALMHSFRLIFPFTTHFDSILIERAISQAPQGIDYTELENVQSVYVFESLDAFIREEGGSSKAALQALAIACSHVVEYTLGSSESHLESIAAQTQRLMLAHRVRLLQVICDTYFVNNSADGAKDLCLKAQDDISDDKSQAQALVAKYPLEEISRVLSVWASSSIFAKRLSDTANNHPNQSFDIKAPIRRSSGKVAEAILGVRKESKLQAAIVAATSRAMPFALEPTTARALAALMKDAHDFSSAEAFCQGLRVAISASSDREQVIAIIEQALNTSLGKESRGAQLGAKRTRD